MAASVRDAGAAARYAIYFVPLPETPLYRFGSAILGYDCFTGRDLPFPDGIDLTPEQWAELTREPRTYGFHATLKAPFRLREGKDEASLVKAFESFVSVPRALPIVDPVVKLLSSFIAIVPRQDDAALRRLADNCVRDFDSYRAPLTDDERARRLQFGLSPAQAANLERWGYPHVFEQFRFHMTLTGNVPRARCPHVLTVLRDLFDHCSGRKPFPADTLALLRQDRPDARFQVLRHARACSSPSWATHA